MNIIIAQIFCLIAWVLLIYSYSKEEINKLLFIQILVAIFDIIAYILLGADAGLFICLIELVKTFLYYKTDKDDLIFKYSLVFYFIVAIATFDKWYSILPVIGSIIDSYGCSKNSKLANICSIFGNSLWFIYDFLILAYVAAASDVIVVICNIIFLFIEYSKFIRIDRFRIIKYYYLNKELLKDIHKLDNKTYGEDNTWDNEYDKEVFNKNKDSLFVIKYKEEFMGYINYLNITEEEYNKFKRIRKYPKVINIKSIIPFKKNRKNFIIIESINVKEEYEHEKLALLINKKFISFIKSKHKQRVFINGILCFALSDFEKSVLKCMRFKEIKKLKDKATLFEINVNDIRKLYSSDEK